MSLGVVLYVGVRRGIVTAYVCVCVCFLERHREKATQRKRQTHFKRGGERASDRERDRRGLAHELCATDTEK